MMGMNMLGMEGKATWINVAVSGRTRADWIGRLGAFYSAAVLPAVIASIIAAGLTHTWYRLPAGLALAVTVLGAALACDALESVILPYATPGDDDSAFSRTRGNWLLGLLGMGGCMVGTFAATLPIAAALTLIGPDRPWPDLGIGIAAIVYTVAIMAGGAVLAGAIQDRRGPEILAVVGR